jgi:hypothetical protein
MSTPETHGTGWTTGCTRLARWLVLLALLALGGCGVLDPWLRGKMYRPSRIETAAEWQRLLATRPDAAALTVDTGAGEQVKVLQLAARPGQVAPVRVFYLHGTYRHAWQNLGKAEPMLRAGLDVALPDYRGWGASSPRVPSEASIHADAWAAWQALQAATHAEGRPVRWVVYGHSMGSAVAVRLAQRLHGSGAYCALVIESAFTRLPDVAEAGVGWLGRRLTLWSDERMASIDRIAQVDPPLWVLHGSRDDTVPLPLGRRLYDAAPAPKQWRQWPLGHSNLQTDPTGAYDQTWREIAAACHQP